MHIWKNSNVRRILPVLALLLACPWARADFGVTMVQSEILEDSVRFTAVVDADLNDRVAEALNKGIPLEVVIDVALDKHRRFLWDSELKTWELRRRIQFHALSEQYVVQGFGAGGEGFYSLDAALKYLGALKDIALIVSQDLETDAEYRIRLRARLDIESLPAPLRPVAYTSAAWRLSSGWKEWKVGK